MAEDEWGEYDPDDYYDDEDFDAEFGEFAAQLDAAGFDPDAFDEGEQSLVI